MLYLIFVAALAAPDEFVAGPVEKVAEGFQFTEGPVWHPKEGWLFSDIPADTIYRADKSVFRQPSGRSNGLAVDATGRLLACEGGEGGGKRVTRTEPDGTITVLADTYLGRRFNSPNDLVIRSDGRIYFTDPAYGVEGADRELPYTGLYAIAPDGKVELVFVLFQRPNGVELAPDEKTLYLSDAGANEVLAFDVAADGQLSNVRPFCRPPHPDGVAVDAKGNLWAGCKDGVHVYGPDGAERTVIPMPAAVTNCNFGDADRRTLFMTTAKAVYKVRTGIAGR